MPLDIVLFRKDKGGSPDLVRESQRRRYADVTVVDKVIEKDEIHKKIKYQLDRQREERGVLQKKLTDLFKPKKGETPEEKEQRVKEAEELKNKKTEFDTKISELEKEEVAALEEVQKLLNTIGNIVHASVPVSDNEEKDNEIVRKWGDHLIDKTRTIIPHHKALWMIGGVDYQRGSEIGGARCYFLKGPAVKLNLALIMYGLDFLEKRGFTQMYTPFFMTRMMMAKTAQLEQFDEELYKVSEHRDEESAKYLIATSEQPISAYHHDEWVSPNNLPYKYAGYSTNFRKEAGSGGRDVWGIFRVHQFEKIEQFVVTAPDKSWEMHEEMIKNAQDFWESLGIPYRVVNIVSKELNNAASKKYDLEGWFYSYDTYRELVSASNCTDYQSRAMEIRFGESKKTGATEKQYVHMLNSTLCATTRGLSAIMENYQTATGVKVPPVLQPYVGNVDFLPFTATEEDFDKFHNQAKGTAKPVVQKEQKGTKKDNNNNKNKN